jgi:hypothetical protein
VTDDRDGGNKGICGFESVADRKNAKRLNPFPENPKPKT